MRIRDPEEGGEELQLNLTPMIDVVFLLLIFFMLATTFLNPEKEIGIELPEAQFASMDQTELDEMIINVFENGTVMVGGQTLDGDALISTLRHAARKNPDIQVTIRGHKSTQHQDIVKVMDACGAAGLVNLAVGTLERRGG